MGTYLRVFDSHEDYESYENSIQFKRPNVCVCLTENMEAHYNPSRNKIYGTQYLTFELITEGTITVQATNSSIAGKNISYSVDGGNSWISLTTSTSAQTIGTTYQTGQKILVKGLNDTYGNSNGNSTQFGGSAQYKVYGNIMSLIYGDDFVEQTSFPTGSTNNFRRLFYNSTGLVDASNLILPATTLPSECYRGMFYGCTSLTQAPELPATILATSCYNAMFYGCTSLTQAPELPATILAAQCYEYMLWGCTSLTAAPELPATTLAIGCYNSMFNGCTSLTTAPTLPATALTSSCYLNMFRSCTSLTTAPELPATILAMQCYEYMLWGCTSLTSAPELPATTLATYCYHGMFKGCTSLTAAPTLPATTLESGCYDSMFNNCTNLNYIKALFTTTPNSSYTPNWVLNVASSGTFVKNSAATWNVTGEHGVPTGWTVQTASS